LSMPCEALSKEISSSILRLRNLKLKDKEGISSLPDTKLFENITLMRDNISLNQKFTFQKADELASPLRDVSQGEACPTDSGFIADQDRATIDKSSTLPYDLAPMVTSPAAVEGSMQQTIPELTALCTNLQRVKLLEDREGVAAIRSGVDAPIKGRSMDEGEAATKRISDDSEEMETILTSMDATTVLACGVVDVPTSKEVPTSSEVVPTASPVFTTATVVTPYRRRKGKEVMVETETLKKQKVQEQIDAQIMIDGIDRNNETIAKYLHKYHQFTLELPVERRIELITDLVKYQDNYAKIYKYQSQQRKPMTKKQKMDYYMAVIRSNLGWKVKDFRGMTFEEVETKFNSVWKQMEDFIPMGSKEEAERIKRKGLNLKQESAKKQKTSEEVPEEVKSHDEVPEEKKKFMVKPFKSNIISLTGRFTMRDRGVTGRSLGWEATQPETLSNRPPTSDKEMKLWVELNRLYEPDDEDQLWTHTQKLMHALVDWRLYDTCGVHHVTAKDKEISMLVEKDYPLRKALALVMICYKLQVENYSQMVNDRVLKIYKIANSPRQQGD
nr:hypothetical protein [Tanacetum cinerariifolium]